MSILATAFDITAVEHLSCTFINWSISEHKRQSSRLTRFIKRLKRVDQVVLRLEQFDLFNGGQSREPNDEWAKMLDMLLNACIERGCQDLEVWYGTLAGQPLQVLPTGQSSSSQTIIWLWIVALMTSWQESIRQLRLFNPSEDYLTMVARKGQALLPAAENLKSREFGVFSVPASPRVDIGEATFSQTPSWVSPGITRLVLASPLLFLPQSRWLSQLFRSTSTLTTLTIHEIHFDQWYWEESFSWMMKTRLHCNLEDLTISGCTTLPTESLLGFIDHLKRLKGLTLRNPLPKFQTSASEERRIDLPSLEEVLAPLDFLLLLSPILTTRGGHPQSPRVGGIFALHL